MCFHATLSISPILPLPCCVHKSVLYVYISIAALQRGSLVPSLVLIVLTSTICVNIRYLFFSFWLTSLCIIGSRFIHLIRTDSNHSFLWLSNMCFANWETCMIVVGGHCHAIKIENYYCLCSLWITVCCAEDSQNHLVKRSIKQRFSSLT